MSFLQATTTRAKIPLHMTTLAAFLLPALALWVPSGYSYSALILLLGALIFSPVWLRRRPDRATLGLAVIESTDFKANKKQQEFARDYADEVLKNIEVRGVSLSGQDDNVGVILTGLYTVYNNMKTAINSPRIKLSSVSFGFEEELEDILSEIESEVYLFLFKGKRAQLSLFGEDGEPTPEAYAETYQADDTEPEEEDDDTEEDY